MPRYTIYAALHLVAAAVQATSLASADSITSAAVVPALETVKTTIAASGVDYFPYEKSQLTPDVINGLTSYLETQNNSDVNAAVFDFANSSDTSPEKRPRACKAYPGSASWPSKPIWRLFDLFLGGSLIEGVPAAAVCYPEWLQYDEAKCADLGVSWTDPAWRAARPTEVDWPVFEGMSCLPPGLGDFLSRPNSTCELGGMPAYVVNVTNVAQIQLAVNFARSLNVRLIVKNSGHDFNAKSTGGGSLSVWTLHLQDIEFLGPDYRSSSGARGPAFKVGAGIATKQIYDAAHERGLMVVGGIARYGVAADQVLSLEVVLPNGTFVSADEKTNPELFFALRGGGGSTWGIVTSMVIRAYEDTTITTLSYSFGSADEDTFWAGVDALWQQFTTWPEAGIWSYFSMACPDAVNCTLSMAPQVAPGLTRSELEGHSAALFANLSSLGITADDVSYDEYSGFMAMFDAAFPDTTNTAGYWYFHSTSRFFPERNWRGGPDAFAAQAAQAAAVGGTTQGRGSFTGYNSRPGVNAAVGQDNAVNPAWREALVFGMGNVVYGFNDTAEEMAAANREMVEAYAGWRAVSDGTYLNEADINEPGWQQSFYGDNYDRLYALKQEVDPWGVFYATGAVGSEDWPGDHQVPCEPVWVWQGSTESDDKAQGSRPDVDVTTQLNPDRPTAPISTPRVRVRVHPTRPHQMPQNTPAGADPTPPPSTLVGLLNSFRMDRLKGMLYRRGDTKDDRDADPDEYAPLRHSGDDASDSGDMSDDGELLDAAEVPFSWLEYTIFAMIGVAMLWAWNMFLAASPYFASRFVDDPWATENFQSAILSVSTLTNLGSMLALTNMQRSANYPNRIRLALLINTAAFALLTLSTSVLTAVSPRWYLAFLLVDVCFAALATGLFQNGAFAFAASFGRPEYTQAIMAGQGVAGVLPALAQIVSVLVVPPAQDKGSTGSNNNSGGDDADPSDPVGSAAFIYFLTAVLVSLCTLLAFLPLVRRHDRLVEARMATSHPDLAASMLSTHSHHDIQEAEQAARRVVGMRALFRKLHWLAGSVFMCFAVAMFFPVFTAKIPSTHNDGGGGGRMFDAEVFIPLAFFAWNLGDLAGRLATAVGGWNAAVRTRAPYLLFVVSVARAGFLPLYLLCNIRGRGAVISSDFFYLVVVQFPFGLTNGWLASNSMMGAAEWVDEDEREAAGGFMGLSLVAGLAVGSLLSFTAAGI